MPFPLSRACVAFVAVAVGLCARGSRAQDAPADPPRCSCDKGKGCWHYLGSPIRPPEDPCRCALCTSHGTCAGRKAPEGWSADVHWPVRANAAAALALIGDAASASAATPAVAASLKSPITPVTIAASRALARIGTADAIDPLIDALEAHSGRIATEIGSALKSITHETFGPAAGTWRNGWRAQRPRGLPRDLPPVENPVDGRYAPPKKKLTSDEPTYYGWRVFSSRIVFVLDISSSMTTLVTPPEGVVKEVGAMEPGPRIEIARKRLADAIEKLPDRTRINLVFFSTDVKLWRPSLIAVGSARKAAIDAVRAAAPEGETNVYGALRPRLASTGSRSRRSTSPTSPTRPTS
jgi:hypothetical protein